MNKKNLKLLVKGLKTLNPSQFDMGDFMNDCKTVGCVVGWSATFKGLEPIDSNNYHFANYYGYDYYYDYSKRLFKLDHSQWEWCFSGDWKDIDNTIEGAIKRIYYLVENGDAPENFENAYYFEDEYRKIFYSKAVNNE